jgi:hypothetical protein
MEGMKTISIHQNGHLALTIQVEQVDGKNKMYIDSQLGEDWKRTVDILIEALCTIARSVKDDNICVVLGGKSNSFKVASGDPFPHES